MFSSTSEPICASSEVPEAMEAGAEECKGRVFPYRQPAAHVATRMQEAGTTPVTLAQMMGHASTGIIQTYAKVLDEYRRHAVKKLEEYRRSKVVTDAVSADTTAPVN